MTRKQCLAKIRSMMPDVRKYIMKESERLLNSGGIDTDNYCQDFVLAKIILTVALENLKGEYRWIHDNNKKEIKNLSHF